MCYLGRVDVLGEIWLNCALFEVFYPDSTFPVSTSFRSETVFSKEILYLREIWLNCAFSSLYTI